MAACLHIYNAGGEQPYTPQTVAAAFSTIAIPVYVTLGALVGSIVLHTLLPAPSEKVKAEKHYAVILRKHYEKADMDSCNSELKEKLLKLQKGRRANLKICAALLAVCSGIFLAYALNSNNFHSSDINGSMVKAVLVLLSCLAIPFGYAVFATYAAKKSILKEIELVKLAPLATRRNTSAPIKAENGKPIQILRWSLVCIAVALLVFGYFAGGTTDVLTKAVNICTECVGLG